MKHLLRMISALLVRRRTLSREEQYLAQAVDAHDLQARQHSLERART
ncbi:hypothetical protein GGR36_001339 [Niveibacterium umoris]|uniref:Uncharacterized protein n=1 Tax=Niveibacterium umoris TaxID=1193620 RepID=A0A840BET1_9RHOO|nr:hypothetical protein [Niveibacterium umoris]